MIIEELVEEKRVRHYSDLGMYILQHPTEIKYIDAVDCVPCKYTYTETDDPVNEEEDNGNEN